MLLSAILQLEQMSFAGGLAGPAIAGRSCSQGARRSDSMTDIYRRRREEDESEWKIELYVEKAVCAAHGRYRRCN